MRRMGLFPTTIEIENLEHRGRRRPVADALVDTGSEYTWVPREVLQSLGIGPQRKQAFMVADSRRIERDIGYALVRAAGTEARTWSCSPNPAISSCSAPTHWTA